MSLFGLIRGFRSSDSTAQPLRLDKATNTLQTIEYEHHEIHAGSSFTAHFYNDVTNIGEMTAIAFNTPSGAKWIHMVITAVATGPAYVALYENPTIDVDEGTDLTIYNRDRNSATASVLLTVETTPEAGKLTSYTEAQAAGANITTTTELMRKYIGSTGKNNGIGSEARSQAEFILAANQQYCVLIYSLTADDAVHNITLDWYEHTNIA